MVMTEQTILDAPVGAPDIHVVLGQGDDAEEHWLNWTDVAMPEDDRDTITDAQILDRVRRYVQLELGGRQLPPRAKVTRTAQGNFLITNPFEYGG